MTAVSADRPPTGGPAAAGARAVVVGIDGSTGSQRALEWAIRAAAARSAPVLAVTVWAWDAHGLSPMATGTPARARARARQVQDTLITRALSRAERPHPVVRTELLEGDPAGLLVETSAGAELLVLGSRADDGAHPLELGGVAEVCVQHSSCPVVVVPSAEHVVLHDRGLVCDAEHVHGWALPSPG